MTQDDEVKAASMWIDPKSEILTWNQAATALFGVADADAIGRSVRALFVEDSVDGLDTLLRRAREGHAGAIAAVINQGRHLRFPVVVTATPVPEGFAQEDRVLLTIVRDTPNASDLDAAARRLAAIVESSDDAIVSKDLNGIVTSWNTGAEHIFGYTADEMIGTSIRRIIPDDRQAEEDRTLATIRRGEKVDHFETIRRRKNGELATISLTVSPVHNATGEVIGASKIARDITALKSGEAERIRLLEENAAVLERLNEVGRAAASDLDRDSMVQAVTDAATELTTAQFGAFFYNVINDSGEAYTLYTISGVPRETFSQFPMPRNTQVFQSTFEGKGVVRSGDITADPRYGHNAPHHWMPTGHLPVRSYLAVPVKSRLGHVIGGLFFGHPEVNRFEEQHERLAVGIASWASVALENARLYQEIQEASRLKDDFLASLSHELRTPLNAIIGYTRIIRSGIVGPDKHEKAIDAIDRNSHALAKIVEDVLDVSRIVSGKLRLNVQAVDLPEVVQAAVDAVAPAAEAKGVRVETVVNPSVARISGDADRLQQIFWNLLSNAVKFTRRGGKVQVHVERKDSDVEVSVSDTGIGIAADFIPHIFERFRQAETGTARERGGLGLGLAITKQLTEMHGGKIAVVSGGHDQGSTFRVRFPLMVMHRFPDEARLHQDRPHRPLALPTCDLSGVHVLVVDDDRDALGVLKEVLESSGARVTGADSAQEALAAIEVDRPDVLVSDIGMPVMDGFALISRIRGHADKRVRELPAAALTAYARSSDRMKVLTAGFQIHLAKPIEPAEFLVTVASLAKRLAT